MGKTLTTLRERRQADPAPLIVSKLTPEEITHYWPSIVREMNMVGVKETWDDRYTTEHFFSRGLAGDLQIWSIGTPSCIYMIVFTQIVIYPKMKSLQVIFAFGTGVLEEAVPLLDATFERFGLLMECDIIESIGRHGWGPLMEGLGAKKVASVYSKSIPKHTVN